MKLSFLILPFFFFNFCYAQQIQPISSNDSLKNINSEPFANSATKSHKKKSSIAALIIPTVLVTYGVVAHGNNGLKQLDESTRNTITSNHPGYKTKVDNYLQFSPALAVYGLNIVGIKGKNNLRDRTIIYALSTIISTAIATPIKHITSIARPDGSAYNSFPSGHTTTAFAAAEFLRQEYKDLSPWYGIAGYAVAATTGALRVYNNRHWVSDVVAGAGFGILSTKLAYWIYPSIKRKLFKDKSVNAMLMPYYQPGGAGGFSFVYNFKK
jgi:membrane-associated phospholipid phosphatase